MCDWDAIYAKSEKRLGPKRAAELPPAVEANPSGNYFPLVASAIEPFESGTSSVARAKALAEAMAAAGDVEISWGGASGLSSSSSSSMVSPSSPGKTRQSRRKTAARSDMWATKGAGPAERARRKTKMLLKQNEMLMSGSASEGELSSVLASSTIGGGRGRRRSTKHRSSKDQGQRRRRGAGGNALALATAATDAARKAMEAVNGPPSDSPVQKPRFKSPTALAYKLALVHTSETVDGKRAGGINAAYRTRERKRKEKDEELQKLVDRYDIRKHSMRAMVTAVSSRKAKGKSNSSTGKGGGRGRKKKERSKNSLDLESPLRQQIAVEEANRDQADVVISIIREEQEKDLHWEMLLHDTSTQAKEMSGKYDMEAMVSMLRAQSEDRVAEAMDQAGMRTITDEIDALQRAVAFDKKLKAHYAMT